MILVLEVLQDGLGLPPPPGDQRRGVPVPLRDDLGDRDRRVSVLAGLAEEVLADDADRVEVAGGGELVGPGLRGARQRLGQRDRLAAGVGADAVDLGEELAAQLRESRGVGGGLGALRPNLDPSLNRGEREGGGQEKG
jgi:hypothetical protein